MDENELDIRIANKEAEYETLARATSALLESHSRERENFDNEIEKKSKKAQKDLDNSLKDKKKRLDEIKKEIEQAQILLTTIQNDYNSRQKAASDELEDTKREKEVLEGIIGVLTSQKLSINAEIDVQTAMRNSLQDEVNDLHSNISKLEQETTKKNDELEDINDRVFQAEMSFSAEKSSWEQEEEKSKNQLSLLRAQLDESSRQLVETQSEEKSIREQLADFSLQLNKREDALKTKEAKIAQTEKRLFNYQKFTGL